MENEYLTNLKEKIENRLYMLLSPRGRLYDKVVEAANYSVSNGGKRIRPILLLEFYKMCGGDDDCAYNFACALEMIHTYSLIHDDLPSMDNDDYRRGKPSCHKQYGEGMALLAGDGLLTEAFSVAAKTLSLPYERVCKCIEILANNAGFDGMVGGQVIDTECEPTDNVDVLLNMYDLKTSHLIRSASTIGATLAGADDEIIAAADKYGYNLGIAFQLIDDILDTTGDFSKLGKPIGSDEKNDKNTAVKLLGVEKCRELAKEYTENALSALDSIEGDKTVLIEITNKLLARDY